MKKINIIKDFKQVKLAQTRHISQLLSDIGKKGLENEKEIEVNIEGCTTDYPATPQFIDYFLNHLSKQKGKKILHIKLDGIANKLIYIFYILILDGEFFNIKEKINDDEISIWIDKINTKLKQENIILKITYTPEKKEYSFGE